MKNKRLNLKEVILFAWGLYKKHVWFLVCCALAIAVIFAITHRVPVIETLVSFVIGLGVIAASLTFVRGHMPTLASSFALFKSYHVPVRFILASILFGLIVAIGFIALIIPGIYFMTRLQFYKYILVDDHHVGVIDSLKKSWEMTEGHVIWLLGFMIVFIAMNIAGALVFGIGLLLTAPLTVIAAAHVYLELHAQMSKVEVATA